MLQLDSRGEQPARLLGQPQTGQQADDEVHDEEQQVGEPPAETHAENQAVTAGRLFGRFWQHFAAQIYKNDNNIIYQVHF